MDKKTTTNNNQNATVGRKYTRTYEDDTTIETWLYNLDITRSGPIEVNIKYKDGADKRWVKDQNETKRIKKEWKKINKVNNNTAK